MFPNNQFVKLGKGGKRRKRDNDWGSDETDTNLSRYKTAGFYGMSFININLQ